MFFSIEHGKQMIGGGSESRTANMQLIDILCIAYRRIEQIVAQKTHEGVTAVAAVGHGLVEFER